VNITDKTFIEFHPRTWSEAKNFASNYSRWIFRGQNNAKYALETSLTRAARIFGVSSDGMVSYERNILSNFQRQAPNYLDNTPKNENVLEWLSIIQHHGGPTRLLDFTHSFYVASYFALQDADSDGAVWCVNRHKLEQCVRAKVSQQANGENQLQYNNPEIIKEAVLGELVDVMATPVEPYFKHVRLAIQQGLFVFPFSITESFENNLFSTISKSLDDLKVSIQDYEKAHMQLVTFPLEGRLLKIHLKKQLHKEARQDLARMNIGSASLFPGLDGFAKSLAACAHEQS
jgi:hypothetical protein